MKHPYLEITYRKGRALAAYLYLMFPPGKPGGYTERFSEGVLIDRSADGDALGIEFLSPQSVSMDDLDRLLRAIGVDPSVVQELTPLVSAEA